MGFYIQDQIDITDKLQVRFGSRVDKFEQQIDNRLNEPVTTTSQDDTRFSPQLGAVYLLDDSLSFYATYGEGFRQLTGSDYAGNPFEPNQSESVEVGVKADLTSMFDNLRGDVTLSAFNIEQSNILVFDSSEEASDGFFLTPLVRRAVVGLNLISMLSLKTVFRFGCLTLILMLKVQTMPKMLTS